MAKQASGTKKSSNPNTSGRKRAGVGGGNRPARAHRDDTPEARTQRARSPKTHPTSKQGSARKDR